MGLEATYHLFYGLLMLVLAAYVALPAWNRWTRNLLLVRRGVKTRGHYHGKGVVVYQLADDRRVQLTTWRRVLRNTDVGEILPVLYDPADPSVAEVMRYDTLWLAPMSNLMVALALVLQAVWVFFGMNLMMSIPLTVIVAFAGAVLASLALFVFYPPSRLSQFAGGEVEQEQGKSYSRRLRRRLAWKKRLPGVSMIEQEVELSDKEGKVLIAPQAACAESLPSSIPHGKAARDQLLRDLVSLSGEADER